MKKYLLHKPPLQSVYVDYVSSMNLVTLYIRQVFPLKQVENFIALIPFFLLMHANVEDLCQAPLAAVANWKKKKTGTMNFQMCQSCAFIWQ
jgi:hypothetical protein